MTKTILLLSSFLILNSAHALVVKLSPGHPAASSQNDFTVSCAPKISYKGEVDTVVVHRTDPRTATVTAGALGRIKTMTTTVVKSNPTKNLAIERFTGPGFLLIVDTQKNVAEFTGSIEGQKISLKNLTCEFNEFNSHPGVTSGN